MYVFVLGLAVRNFKVISNYEIGAFAIYSLSPFVALIMEILVPSLSLSYAASAVSILIVYVLLQSEYRVNAQEREKDLIVSSNTDELTGLQNRRAYSQALEMIQEGGRIGVIFCDINGLKYFNDTYGHTAGDRLIKAFSDRLCSIFDRDDVFRISGDEFVVISDHVTEAELNFRAHILPDGGDENEYKLAAVGCAYGDSVNVEKLINQAEEGMYVQKSIFHRNFPKYIRKGSVFMRNISDGGSDVAATLRNSTEAEDENVKAEDSAKNTLLLIEDSDQHGLIKLLLESDYNVIDIPDIKEALDVLENRADEIAIVLIDADLPRINGLDFLRIKQTIPEINAIPVIVTALGGERNMESRYLRLGAFDFIHRPYSPEMLLNRLQRTIEMRESAATLSAVEKDELTGVYTREVFNHRMLRHLERDAGAAYDLAAFDVQNFKVVNERHGERIADSVLHSMGEYIGRIAGKDGLAGRYSGDQFMLFLPHERAAGPDFWEKLTVGMERNCPLDDIIIKCGVYENVDGHMNAASLCYRVLVTLRSIKHQYGKTCARFDEQLQQSVKREQQMELTMEKARREGQFEVYYQPKCDAKTGRIAGAEALLRWQHPEFGFLPPDTFIPLFERNGFITDADYYVWEKTIRNIKRWREQGLNIPHISVNASRRDFGAEGQLSCMQQCVADFGIAPSLLHIEVTETMLAEHADELVEQIRSFRNSGFAVEMDDFGAGYSSLNELAGLPIDIVKFDKKFIDRYRDSRRKQVLAASISLVKNLGMLTVIEGVETEEQKTAVAEMGGDVIQGYYFSKPLTEAEFEQYLKKEKETHDA